MVVGHPGLPHTEQAIGAGQLFEGTRSAPSDDRWDQDPMENLIWGSEWL